MKFVIAAVALELAVCIYLLWTLSKPWPDIKPQPKRRSHPHAGPRPGDRK